MERQLLEWAAEDSAGSVWKSIKYEGDTPCSAYETMSMARSGIGRSTWIFITAVGHTVRLTACRRIRRLRTSAHAWNLAV